MVNGVCNECGKPDGEGDLSTYGLPVDEHQGMDITLCPECAANMGFCLICGNFFGGTEEFMKSGVSGCCCDCRDEINDFGDWEEDFPGVFDPPY